ncbi:DUF456 domain-containing protein [Robertkochia flava]|uniref:DUF456 domain-containing protein n=1 Tax=Robertkochia flava TaxID=3447986 RepID=UPI001CCA3189|nr:DUF456 domain-containing protein [Robertkochia marina]
MDIFLILLGLLLLLIGLLGSFLPALPGPPLSWVGLLLLYLTKSVPMNWWMLGVTLAMAILVVILDYIIPAAGTKRFGGSKAGIWGTTIGLLVALVFPIFGVLGIIIWPFLGALAGEFLNKAGHKQAFKAAFGSFLGFLTGTFLKFLICMIYLGIFIWKVWEYKGEIFSLGG